MNIHNMSQRLRHNIILVGLLIFGGSFAAPGFLRGEWRDITAEFKERFNDTDQTFIPLVTKKDGNPDKKVLGILVYYGQGKIKRMFEDKNYSLYEHYQNMFQNLGEPGSDVTVVSFRLGEAPPPGYEGFRGSLAAWLKSGRELVEKGKSIWTAETPLWEQAREGISSAASAAAAGVKQLAFGTPEEQDKMAGSLIDMLMHETREDKTKVVTYALGEAAHVVNLASRIPPPPRPSEYVIDTMIHVNSPIYEYSVDYARQAYSTNIKWIPTGFRRLYNLYSKHEHPASIRFKAMYPDRKYRQQVREKEGEMPEMPVKNLRLLKLDRHDLFADLSHEDIEGANFVMGIVDLIRQIEAYKLNFDLLGLVFEETSPRKPSAVMINRPLTIPAIGLYLYIEYGPGIGIKGVWIPRTYTLLNLRIEEPLRLRMQHQHDRELIQSYLYMEARLFPELFPRLSREEITEAKIVSLQETATGIPKELARIIRQHLALLAGKRLPPPLTPRELAPPLPPPAAAAAAAYPVAAAAAAQAFVVPAPPPPPPLRPSAAAAAAAAPPPRRPLPLPIRTAIEQIEERKGRGELTRVQTEKIMRELTEMEKEKRHITQQSLDALIAKHVRPTPPTPEELRLSKERLRRAEERELAEKKEAEKTPKEIFEEALAKRYKKATEEEEDEESEEEWEE